MENVPATFLKNPSPPLNQTLNLIFDVTLHIKINLSSYWRTPTKPAAILIPSTNDDSTCIPAKESGVQNMWNHVKKYWCKKQYIFSLFMFRLQPHYYLQNNPNFRRAFPSYIFNAELFNAKNQSGKFIWTWRRLYV